MEKKFGIILIMTIIVFAVLSLNSNSSTHVYSGYSKADSIKTSIDSMKRTDLDVVTEEISKDKVITHTAAMSIAVSDGAGYDGMKTSDFEYRKEKSAEPDVTILADEKRSTVEAGRMTAGEWSDIENWSFWTSLFEKDQFRESLKSWDIQAGSIKKVTVLSSDGKPAKGAVLKGYSNTDEVVFSVPVDANGDVAFVSDAWKFDQEQSVSKLRIQVDRSEYEPVFSKNKSETVLRIPIPSSLNQNLEIGFIVDATGSMSDEMEFLKAELDDVINKVHSYDESINIRTGCVFYQDHGDDYLTHVSSLSKDIRTTHSFITSHYAGGGGDFPEAVESGLQTGLDKLNWSEGNIVKLAFLILDAPPHNNPENKERIKRLIRVYASKGIRLIPVTASGIDKQTEFLMRQIAILTGGTYVFITDHSGIGNSHLEPSIGKYKVEFLNELMARVIKKYI